MVGTTLHEVTNRKELPLSKVFVGLRRRLALLGICCVALPLLSVSAHAQSTPFAAEVVGRLGVADTGQPITVDGETVFGAKILRRMYQAVNYEPLWNEAAVSALAFAIADSSKDGLNPEDYRFAGIDTPLLNPRLNDLPIAERVDTDILLSEAFLRLAYQLYFGKVDPQRVDPDINFSREGGDGEAVPLLVGAIKRGRIAEALSWARPSAPAYARLRTALARYRLIEAAGGWPTISPGATLRAGDTDERVGALRERLTKTGDVTALDTPDATRFDDALAQAVGNFQRRHGLTEDGAVGPATLAAMNVPVEQRIDQIRVNLERLRWILHENHDEFMVVDIAGFGAIWVKDGEIVWREQVQVGKEYTQTPVFAGKMTYLEFNPTWTIPPGILRRSVIPGIRKDPEYLQKRGYLLLTQSGEEVDPSTVDWSSLKGFPYIVRQPAGPTNALGLVKFIFPNPHFVFLHDTNHRELFDRSKRTFSSGCIRVRNPFDLAEALLSEQGWTRARIDELRASGQTRRVNLDKPLRIFLTYFTARMRPGTEELHFREDIYERDPPILAALQGDFRPRESSAAGAGR